MLKVYVYDKCSTCRKAIHFLDEADLAYERIPIREQPPTVAELKKMAGYLEGGSAKLFNTAGRDYREQAIKDQLPGLSDAQRFTLLHSNGNLVKRPFAIGDGVGTVGFHGDRWKELFT